MTIIAAYRNKNGVAIACDSQGTSNDTKQYYGSKMVKRRNWVCGVAWSYRVMDLIQECEELDFDITSIKDVRLFRDILKKEVIENAGGETMAASQKTIMHPVAIIIINNKGNIYSIEDDYQIHNIEKYYAIGSGRDIALGALFASDEYYAKDVGIIFIKDFVKVSVEAACRHNTGCGGKIHVASFQK